VKIIYGSPIEKAFLCGAYLFAAATTTGVLLREQLLRPPYFGLPVYLVICAVVLCLLPTRERSTGFRRGGLYRTLPAVFLMGAIFLSSSFTFPPKLPTTTLPDVVFHFVEFFALGLLTARMVAPDKEQGLTLRSFLLALSIVLGFALLDEIHQGFVPGRNPDWVDLLVDASGGLLGILVHPLLFTAPKKASG
jgi:VanZ family protein